jgi:cytochrome c biogenesis protein CcmG/thiol:disulfide interchange protein DsbE
VSLETRQTSTTEPQDVRTAQGAESGTPAAGRSRLRWVLLPITLAVLGLLTVFGIRLARGDSQLGEVQLHPYTAPNFGMALFGGDNFSLAQQRGRVVVLNFWASWCVPCQQEAPALERVWQRYRDRNVVLVGVDIKDTPDDAHTFLQRYIATYPNGFDSQKQIYIDYGVYGLPETFVVDQDGMVLHHIIGPVTEAQLERWLDPLVANSAAGS